MHRDRFLEALLAEGLFCSTAHNQPLYLNPEWQWKSLVPDARPAPTPHCPEAERVFSSEVVSLGKGVLQNRPLVEKALAAIHKLRANVDELKRDPVPRPKPSPAPQAAAAPRPAGAGAGAKRKAQVAPQADGRSMNEATKIIGVATSAREPPRWRRP